MYFVRRYRNPGYRIKGPSGLGKVIMKNPTNAILTKASDALEGGKTMKEVLNMTFKTSEGTETLSYSQVWLFHTRRNMPEAEYITATQGSDEWFAAITQARNADQQSWGYIAVRCNAPEGQVRKAFTEKTGLRSQGLRINHGGRFLDRDPVLYQGEHKAIGVAIPKTAPRSDFRKFVAQPEENLEKEELVRRLSLLGKSTKGSKAVLVKRLLASTTNEKRVLTTV